MSAMSTLTDRSNCGACLIAGELKWGHRRGASGAAHRGARWLEALGPKRGGARLVAAFSLCVLALLTAACDPVSERYFREGAGTDLNSSNLAQSSQLQDEYVAYICAEAGYSLVDPSGGTSCFANGGWTAFAQAGMNDIDQRCDAYLAWLDAQRRDRSPVLNELSAVETGAHSIMTVAGVSSASLNILTSAFGLATATYSNLNSRLLLDVNNSTVQTIVYTRQFEFRQAIARENVTDRPRAIYLLRNYLRICMPITIETDINTSVTLVQRDVGGAVKARPVVSTVAAVPLTALQNLRPPQRPPQPTNTFYAVLFDSYSSNTYPKSYVDRILSALCVPSTQEMASPGAITKSLIDIYEHADPSATVDGKLDSREVANVLVPPGPSVPCSKDGARNYFERTTYTDAGKIADLVTRLNKSPAGEMLAPNATLSDARMKIKLVRASLADKLTLRLPDQLSDEMTRDLATELFKLK